MLTLNFGQVKEPYDPQQSFLFGVDSFERVKPLVDANEPIKRDIFTTDKSNTPTSTFTNWVYVFRHWFLSSVALPLYVVALVTKSWRDQPTQLSKVAGTFFIFMSFIFYGLLITIIALHGSDTFVKTAVPIQQTLLTIFLYLMCCFAESMLKHTHIIYQDQYSYEDADAKKKEVVIQTNRNNRWSTATFLDTITFISAPTNSQKNMPFFISLFVSLAYTCIVVGVQIYFLSSVQQKATVIVYILFVSILHFILSFSIVVTLCHVALRLYTRSRVVTVFKEAIIYTKGDHCFQLQTLENVNAWHKLRQTLLSRYGFPSIYVDVVISAAFTLWVPLVMVAVMDFLFQAQITMTALIGSTLAMLILIFLLVCVAIASNVQDILSSTEALRKHEFALLISNGEQKPLIRVLQRLSQLIETERDNAVVFQVWGFALNKRMVIFLGGVLVTLASSVVVKLGSRFTA